jgi:lysophospholipase L1-like esterase
MAKATYPAEYLYDSTTEATGNFLGFAAPGGGVLSGPVTSTTDPVTGVVSYSSGSVVFPVRTPSILSNRNVVLFGDSISAQGNDITPTGWTIYDWRGYFTQANAYLNSSLTLVANCGVNGDTTAGMLTRLGAGGANDPLIYTHDICIVEGGTNDVANATAASTVISNLKSIVTTLKNAGKFVVLATIPPRSDLGALSTSAGANKFSIQKTVNSWIRQYCNSSGGPILFDIYRALTDPSTGLYITTATIDGVHPNFQGAAFMGSTLATALSPITAQANTVTADAYQSYVTNPNALGSNASGTNGTYFGTGITGVGPNAWAALAINGGAAVSSIVSPTSGALDHSTAARLAITATTAWQGAQWQIGGTNGGVTHRGGWCIDVVIAYWQPTTALQIGDRVPPEGSTVGGAYSGLWGVVVQSGTTGGTEPTWPTQLGQQVTDGTVIWEMVQPPFAPRKSQHWGSAFYVGLGAILRPGTPTGFYYQCTTAGQANAADPTWSTVLGGTTTDGTAVWTTIAIPTYSFYAEVEFATSGLTAGKGANFLCNFVIFDDSNVGYTGSASYLDINPADQPTYQSSTILPVTGAFRTASVTLPANKGIRFTVLTIGAALDAGASMNLDVKKVSIKPVITL